MRVKNWQTLLLGLIVGAALVHLYHSKGAKKA